MRDETSKSLKIQGDKKKLTPQNALLSMDRFFHTPLREFSGFIPCENIVHFEHFTMSGLSDSEIEKMNEKIRELANAQEEKSVEELKEEQQKGKITLDELIKQIQAKPSQKAQNHGYTITAELSKHYYLPMLCDDEGKGKIHCAIAEKSELEFLQDLATYMRESNNVLQEYQWCFSKIVEKLDSIFIPYFDTEAQEQRRFYPDFIFWLKHKRSGAYRIIFLDPKGLKIEANARDKLRGFKELFCDKALSFEGIEVSVDLKYYNKDSNVAKDFHKHIASRVCEVFARCFEQEK